MIHSISVPPARPPSATFIRVLRDDKWIQLPPNVLVNDDIIIMDQTEQQTLSEQGYDLSCHIIIVLIYILCTINTI